MGAILYSASAFLHLHLYFGSTSVFRICIPYVHCKSVSVFWGRLCIPYPYSVFVSAFWAWLCIPYPYSVSVSAFWAWLCIPYPYPYPYPHFCLALHSLSATLPAPCALPVRVVRRQNTLGAMQTDSCDCHTQGGRLPDKGPHRPRIRCSHGSQFDSNGVAPWQSLDTTVPACENSGDKLAWHQDPPPPLPPPEPPPKLRDKAGRANAPYAARAVLASGGRMQGKGLGLARPPERECSSAELVGPWKGGTVRVAFGYSGRPPCSHVLLGTAARAGWEQGAMQNFGSEGCSLGCGRRRTQHTYGRVADEANTRRRLRACLLC